MLFKKAWVNQMFLIMVISEIFEVVAENQELSIYITCEKRIKVSEIEKKTRQ